ncbi:MAG: hypothetical protein JNL79_03235 [Myxococcales bacterium]|nr:hypothetical protein [Myxococcales bacterium]
MRRVLVAFGLVVCWGCEARVTRLKAPPDPKSVTFVASSEVRSVAVGWNDICVLMADGNVRCKRDWRPDGKRGLMSFAYVAGVKDAVGISVGIEHACATTAQGAVLCWGSNEAGQVGGDEAVVRIGRPVPLDGPAAEVRVGEKQTCARLATGAVRCWGAVAGTDHAPPTPIDWFADAAALDVSTEAVCTVTKAGVVRCSFAGARPLEPIAEGSLARAVALGRFRGCALLADGTVQCFQLQRPANAPVTGKVPAFGEAVPNLTDVVQVGAGLSHFCARKKDASVWCWGSNNYGQLGHGDRDGSNAPVQVKRLPDALELSVGGDRTCARKAAGMVVCWGADLLADSMYRALTGIQSDPGPPGPHDSLAPEELRVPMGGTP